MEYKTLPVDKIIDLSLEVGMVPGAKFHYKWDEYADWQLKGLIEVGLKPEHKLLDVGCGPLRLGLQAIQYLNDGNYFGMDAYPPYIKLGELLYNELGLQKPYKVLLNRDFDFSQFGEQFDFAMSQSVFTHLSKDQTVACLRQLKKVMKPGGKLLFTNIIASNSRGFLYSSMQPMITGTYMDDEFYQKMADELGAKFHKNVLDHPTQYCHILEF